MTRHRCLTLFAVSMILSIPGLSSAAPKPPAEPTDFLLPDATRMIPFAADVPVIFVTKNQPEWARLKTFWNEGKQDDVNPSTGEKVTRRVVKLRLPLGLTTAPSVPGDNPMTLAKWNLGKKLYYDPILSTSGDVACASCHNPTKGFTDQKRTSTGINGAIGPINSPTILNASFNKLQFWDGRAADLEDQSQGPVANNKEMFAGQRDPWVEAVERLRANPDYVKAFMEVFGHAPTRDATAKAIATYERTVFSGDSLHDHAEAIMRKRVIAEESGKFELKAEDYTAALADAFAKKETHTLTALKLDAAQDAGKSTELGKRLLNGRTLFFGKARCATCHTGDVFSDGSFHNLGIGATKEGDLPVSEFGRFVPLPTGHKDITLIGAFKTPGLRGLVDTAPYMHSGDEKTLEEVVELYNRGGNINPYLSDKMRDTTAEAAYLRARAAGQPLDPSVRTFGPAHRPIIPFKLNLTPQEKADLVLFLRALNGSPVAEVVANPTIFVK